MKDEESLQMDALNTYSEEVKQQYNDSCAIKSQQLVLESNGYSITESELRNEAIANHWYTPGYGTPIEDIGNLLESHGLEVNHFYNATVADIANEISQGHQVIIGVDSGELWNKGIDETFEDVILGPYADHALLVSGFSIDPISGTENVLLTDPGTGEIFADYPIEQFEDAWDDSDNFMISSFDTF